MKRKGIFITFEGIEGCGKSTQLAYARSFMKKKRRKCIVIREPGGTRIGEKIRDILLDKKHHKMTPEAELLLYCAARAQITREVIIPELNKGHVVLCDRFYDSTRAYQGYALSMNHAFVEKMCAFAAQELKPDLTFLLDVPVSIGLKRAERTDRIENRSRAYHTKVRKGFRMIAQKEPRRFVVIDGTQTRGHIRTIIERKLDAAIRK